MGRLELGEAQQGLMVTEEIAGAHPQHPNYPLLPEDLVAREADGSWHKYAPGLAVVGFVLSEEQVQTLQPVWLQSAHLFYDVTGEVDPHDVDPRLFGEHYDI